MTTAEAATIYADLLPKMVKAYSKSGNSVAAEFASYRIYSSRPYTSATHGGRQVMNYANDKARAYGAFENAGIYPEGAILAKPSFAVKGNGSTQLGPLFVMEKMEAGFNSDSDDWRYTMILPNGSIFGTTAGDNSNKVGFCVQCHQSVTPDQDHAMLVPDEFRVN